MKKKTKRKSNGYNGNKKIKKDGVRQTYTRHQLSEYIKCSDDPVYFIENYMKIVNIDDGVIKFKPYDCQKKMIKHLHENRFSCVLAPRQVGKSTVSTGYLLWYVCFNSAKSVGILANKGDIAREMLGRIVMALENLPFFLQPGCKVVNKGSIDFSNQSTIIATGTSSSSVRGRSLSLLYLDEFAFVHDANTFYTSTYPVIASGKDSKVIITSTPNGVGNMFHSIWESAISGNSSYKPFSIKWDDVPGRDDEWKKETISNTSMTQWEQEHECSFLGYSDTLVSPDCLLGLRSVRPIYEKNNIRVYKEPEAGRKYIALVDVSGGCGIDSSTLTIIDVTDKGSFEQVAVYRDNNISPLLFPNIIHKYVTIYNEAHTIIESNGPGVLVATSLYYELEYENVYVESVVRANAIGVLMTKKVKRIGCSNFKDIIEQGKLKIVDAETIKEINTFVAVGKSFEAKSGNHDDLVMNLILFGWFISTETFQSITDINIKNMLYEEKLKMIHDDILPFGFFSSDNLTDIAIQNMAK